MSVITVLFNILTHKNKIILNSTIQIKNQIIKFDNYSSKPAIILLINTKKAFNHTLKINYTLLPSTYIIIILLSTVHIFRIIGYCTII